MEHFQDPQTWRLKRKPALANGTLNPKKIEIEALNMKETWSHEVLEAKGD